ncbi:hypothetical protein IWW36_003525 [Coemansia brasiliensis]|uniref:FAM192A/Fyv6 N-terminal domain-containing protein n=1 Tax=Coemansia brasiliensis TaxID=2650707 RepID=A0A9W8I7M4_9FUNG|nr:hypothetical protein IWW36_003525 [Coemansia brasiliensis]
MSGTDPSSRFISESAIEEARSERQEAWKRAYESGKPSAPEADYDPRTLYERLQEQKLKKSEALAESRRAANQIHKLDDEETRFLDSVHEAERLKQMERKRKEQEELAKFKEQMAQKQQAKDEAKPLQKPQGVARSKERPAGVMAKVSGAVRHRPKGKADNKEDVAESPHKRRKQEKGSTLLGSLAAYESESDSN